MTKIRIGIIGHGFVGKAVDYGFTNESVEKVIVDPIYGTGIDDLGNLSNYDFIFVCVPTPQAPDGSIDDTIINTVMHNLMLRVRINCIIVIKSTITPEIAQLYDNDGVIYNPEFLTEGFAKADFVRPNFHVIGGDEGDAEALASLYRDYSLADDCPVFQMSMVEASIVKYAINSFLALKVTFFNQLYDYTSDLESNYSRVVKAVAADPRIGSSHTKVPGFDGKRGFGGACFPKDTSALINSTDRFTIIEECVKINNEYRSVYSLDEREKQQNVIYNGKTKKE